MVSSPNPTLQSVVCLQYLNRFADFRVVFCASSVMFQYCNHMKDCSLHNTVRTRKSETSIELCVRSLLTSSDMCLCHVYVD